jgi:AcrR family transcriptional regulator
MKQPRRTEDVEREPRRRGSNPSRRAATRARVLESAVRCLYELGYAATTTTLVAQRAGVSRGALLHQFPTKGDLMIAVADHLVETQNARRREKLALHAEGLERFLAVTPTVWDDYNGPGPIAFMELVMGARSDPELAARLPEVGRRIEHDQQERVWRMARHAGVEDRELVDVLFLLSIATMRGLAITRMLTGNEALVDKAMKMMLANRERAIREALAKAKAPAKAPGARSREGA